MSKKSTEKTASKKGGSDQSNQAATAPRGREHTIAEGVKAMKGSKKHAATPVDEAVAKAPAAAKAKEPKVPTQTGGVPNQPPDDLDTVVFAFRLTRAERDLIHAAAGSAKASKFVRNLAVAAAQADGDAIQQILIEVHATGR